ncbi:SPJ_0845 family protein [Secundilactobacillus folii]|uniref:SPJ_0845 family protein n=1 Tax=Secundilactobacillus folii TaxID=2678357 RepID=UPI0015642ED6|nr:SPJ_0845 family protein [Secundilactobacillus folii]
MGLKVKRQDDLNAMFGKFAEMDLKDEKRDKFLKHDEKKDASKKAKALIKEHRSYHK